MCPENASKVRVGPAGWSYPDWKGVVYPPDMGRNTHPVRYLAKFFDIIEVNATFYRPANPDHAQRWIAEAECNPSFQFTAKLWERFTHKRESWPSHDETRTFRRGIEPLMNAGKFGALLVQFPWSFKRTPGNRRWLARIVDTFSDFPLALEIRHDSWDRQEVYDGLAERNVAFCNIDQPSFDHSIKPGEIVTAPLAYVRLHGRNHENWFRDNANRDERYDYLYSASELNPWLTIVQNLQIKTSRVFVILNNHFRGQAVANAFQMLSALRDDAPAPPPQLVAAYPQLQQRMPSKVRGH